MWLAKVLRCLPTRYAQCSPVRKAVGFRASYEKTLSRNEAYFKAAHQGGIFSNQ
jgi:hypothetical protein